MENLNLRPGQIFTLSFHTYDASNYPVLPVSIDSSYNGGMPYITVLKNGVVVDSTNSGLTLSAAGSWGIVVNPNGGDGSTASDLVVNSTVCNRYDVQFTPNIAQSGIYQIVAAAQVNYYEGCAVIATVSIQPPVVTGALLLTGPYAGLYLPVDIHDGNWYYSNGTHLIYWYAQNAVWNLASALDGDPLDRTVSPSLFSAWDNGSVVRPAALALDPSGSPAGTAAIAAAPTTPVGPGGIATTITVTDTSNNPIPGVSVWITTDAGGNTVIAGTLTTNPEGQALFTLAAGTYYAWRQKNGYNFANPQAITVS